jgi:hypothetical protein
VGGSASSSVVDSGTAESSGLDVSNGEEPQ